MMNKAFNKIAKPWFVSLCVTATVVVGRELYSGYILLLDLPWTPIFPLTWTSEGINNSYLVYLLFHFLTLLIKSWFVEKVFLITVVYLIIFISLRFLPYIKNGFARFFAASLYLFNPFVYSRFVSGQWFLLVAYSLLPLLLYCISEIKFSESKSAFKLSFVLFLIGIFSIHIFYLSVIYLVIYFLSWFLATLINSIISNPKTEKPNFKNIALWLLSAFGALLVLISYWLVPAMLRLRPLESSFDINHFKFFSASANGGIPVWMNVLGLGGFWGEGLFWKYYFLWPQQNLLFWIALSVILFLAALGFIFSVIHNKNRYKVIFFGAIAVFSYITSLGMSNTIFYKFNYFLYKSIPFWSGLRDSQKIVSYLALMYAMLSGLGLEWVLVFMDKRVNENKNRYSKYYKNTFICFILFSPLFMGLYMFGGFWGQIRPVNYPDSWQKLKNIVDGLPEGEKVLVLPWHSYLSLYFNNNRLISNPVQYFFDSNKLILSKSVDISGIRSQNVDSGYLKIDEAINNADIIPKTDLLKFFKENSIEYVLIIPNPDIPDSEKGLTYWSQFSGNADQNKKTKNWGQILDFDLKKSFISDEILLKKIDFDK